MNQLQDEEVSPTEPDPSTSYMTWIRDWTAHLTEVSNNIQLPAEATASQPHWIRWSGKVIYLIILIVP